MKIDGLEAPLESICFSPNGHEIATGGQDFRARVWNVRGGREILQLQHELVVWSTMFSPDAKYLATGSEDGSARIWERSTLREIARLTRPGPVRMAGFTRDGTRLLTASFDRAGLLLECRAWEWRAEDLIRDACHHVAGRLSEKEWRRYFGGEEYKPVCRDLVAQGPQAQ